MIEVINEKYFHLKNEKISYLFYIMENQQLGHLYYGAPLDLLNVADLAFLSTHENKSAGTVKFSAQDGKFTLSDRFQEYPVYGSSDFKEGAIEVESFGTPLYLNFQYQNYQVTRGKKRRLSTPATFGSVQDVETIALTLLDSDHQLALTMNFSIFADSCVIAKSQTLTNIGQETKTITKMLSGILEVAQSQYDFVHLSGAWLKERQIMRQSLAQGTVSVGSLKGASGHQHNPFVALQEQNTTLTTGNCYGLNLIYSGNFLAQAEVDEWQHTRMMLGIHPSHFSWSLAAGESFTTPEAVLAYSAEGLNGLSQAFSDFTERHIIAPKWLKQNRPIVFNNWEATYFDFNHDKLVSLAREGKELGMECFVLDDGWFGRRNDDRSSLGDWYHDVEKFPNGLSAFANEIHQMGLKFGVWFEPEMISPDSRLYQAHPDWAVHHPYERRAIGRGQYVLDFANPEIVDAIFEQMRKVIIETKLDFIKWDMNRNITEAYSNYLETIGVRQTEFFHRYILGVYALYEKILTEFPDILIEGCAGGGGRFDLGILFYSPQIWPSDDSDAIERLKILTGTVMAYPLSTFSNHVSAAVNHQVMRQTTLKMRHDVAIFGPLGYELDLHCLTDDEKLEIAETIRFYKTHRTLLNFGKFYQLLNYEQDRNEVAWAVYDQVVDEAIIGFYRVLAQPNNAAIDYIKLPFVSENKYYEVNGVVISGAVLKHIGIRKPYQYNGANQDTAEVSGDFQSFIFLIKSVKELENDQSFQF